ncbi:ATP-binding protein [Longispora sp. NPDC051575]|uniref:sensor histidine kinase n=1 Tax=Longispora sp. NPDC051575 TaxID=3154943 RepID=UPI0034253999
MPSRDGRSRDARSPSGRSRAARGPDGSVRSTGGWWRAGRWGRWHRGAGWPVVSPAGWERAPGRYWLAVQARAAPRRISSVRLRAALASALAAALVFGLGALWMRSEIYDTRMAAERGQANLVAQRLVSTAFRTGEVPPDLAGRNEWIITLTDGTMVTGGGEITMYAWGGRMDLPRFEVGSVEEGWSSEVIRHARTWGDEPYSRFDGKDVLFAVAASGKVTAAQLTAFAEKYGTVQEPYLDQTNVLAYVVVLPDEAEAAVRALDRALLGVVPLAVFFVALMAWFVTGRALRPVEEIRARLAEISGQELDRRVPVPPSGDEITRLAVTTNATLDRLEEAVARQRRFVADAAHELRSPLASLRTGLEVTLAHPEGVDWPAVFGTTLHDARRLGTLTDDLLLLARLDRTAGHDTATGRPVDLADLAREQTAERGYLHPDGPRFTAHTDGPAVVTGDESQLGRLLRNLLDNAARHATTEVRVAVGTAGGRVLVVVTDDGPGVAPADRERIFERFTRLDAARDRDSGGTGLGLAIARDLAAQHGGTLTAVDSPRGARFELDLPEA